MKKTAELQNKGEKNCVIYADLPTSLNGDKVGILKKDGDCEKEKMGWKDMNE